ncbi:MAG: hypothetical protein AAFR04_10940 [Pseudomonadota bacterium]
MAQMVIWMLAIAGSTAALVITAAANMHYIHMAIAAVMAIFMALLASRENKDAIATQANESAMASLNARYMGLVWTWGALVLFITYALILKWNEWLGFFIAFMVAAGLCLFFSALLSKDAEQGKADRSLLDIAWYLSVAQLVGMIITMLGLLIDGKMWRFLNPRFTDWAANNVFFFGALALAVISWLGIQASRRARGS